jgi:hypothetical protein
MRRFGNEANSRLTWILRPDRGHDSRFVAEALSAISKELPGNMVTLESLGVEQLQRNEAGSYLLKFMKDDDSTVELQCDAVVALTHGREGSLSSELFEGRPAQLEGCPGFVTNEPGFYRLRGGSIEEGAGVGLSDTFRSIRELFAMLAGRQDLDLYDIISRQQNVTDKS